MPTIAEQLTKLIELKTELANNLIVRGVEVSTSATFNDLVPQVLSVEDVTDETTTYTNLNTKLRNVINSLPSSKEIALQEKTITPASFIQTVEPDGGYDGLSKVTVDAMPTVAQATPSITISSSGLITAKSMQLAGYVEGGTKTATNQLTTQGAKTITPSTSSQTAVASGVYTTGAITVAAIPSSYVKPIYTKGTTTYTPTTSNQTIAAKTYCTGVQTIKGDANLIASNIKSGVSIFGVAGTLEAGEDVSEEVAEYTDLNTELEEVISSLPSAGGGSLETVKLTINYIGLQGPAMPGEDYVNYVLYYIDGSGNPCVDEYTDDSLFTKEYTVLKNSLIQLARKNWTYFSGMICTMGLENEVHIANPTSISSDTLDATYHFNIGFITSDFTATITIGG